MIRFLRFLKRLCRIPWMDSSWQPYWALEGEDVLVALLVRAGDSPRGRTYIDVGAHRPRRYSVTYALYRLGWRGLLVEPHPDLAAELRRGRIGDVVEQCGVSDTSGEMVFRIFENPCYSTFSESQAAQLEVAEGVRPTRCIATPVRRLRDLAAEYPNIFASAEFLKIDAEGHDLNVLQSNEWSSFRPRYVMVEMLGETAQSAPRQELAAYLEAQGYRLRSFLYHSAVFERTDVRPLVDRQ